jgi:hypothetical protein
MEERLKYTQKNNGIWYYRRKVPLRLKDHPFWNGSAYWSHSLNLKLDVPQHQLNLAWNEADQKFADICSNIESRNIPVLNEIELDKRAINWLEMHNLKPGDADPELLDESTHGERATRRRAFIDQIVTEGPAFEDLMEWGKKAHYDRKEYVEVPANLKIQERAWVLLNGPKMANKPTLFGDLWERYENDKQLDMADHDNKNKRRRWERFYQVVGDTEITSGSIDTGLRAWLKERLSGASIKRSTVDKELKNIVAVLNHAKRNIPLQVTWTKPDIPLNDESKQTPIILKGDYPKLVELISDESARAYAPWKEFTIRLMLQSSMILKEILRLDRSRVHLDAKYPFIDLYESATKTAERKRIVPITQNLPRMIELYEQMDEGQTTALPPSILATETSNPNAQLNSLFAKVDPVYRTYCARHSFKHYLHLSDANHMDVLYVGGWSGQNKEMSAMLRHYGQAGIDDPEMIKRLWDTARNAFTWLKES